MKLKPKHSIAEYFNDIEDVRIERGKKHQLIDIITISICAVVCGADGWIDTSFPPKEYRKSLASLTVYRLVFNRRGAESAEGIEKSLIYSLRAERE